MECKVLMTKKQKRSPYDDVAETATGPSHMAAKLPRGGVAARKKPTHHTGHTKHGVADSNNFRMPLSNEYAPASVSPPTPTAPVERMSIETLEQKKMLLPYLDKIEYINVQLRQRGLLPDDDAMHHSVPSPAYPLPQSPMQVATSPSLPGSQTQSAMKPSIKPVTTSPKIPSNQEPQATTTAAASPLRAHVLAEEEDASTPSHTRSNMSASVVPLETLRRRYTRLFNSIHPARVSLFTPRVRPINWLLRLLEEIYDALTATFVLGTNRGRPTTTPSPRPDAMDPAHLASKRGPSTPTKQAHNMGNVHAPPPPSPPLSTPRLAMPLLVRKHIDTTLGLADLADQACLDLMLNLEMALDNSPQAALFALFVREMYDDDALLFFLVVRHVVQREFDLQLRAKSKLRHSSAVSKTFMASGLVHRVAHPLVHDGSSAVLLSRAACELTWRRVFAHAIEMGGFRDDTGAASPFVLAQYTAQHQMAMLFRAQRRHHDSDRVAVDQFFVWSVDAFRHVAEDIIAQYKYKDDGESLRGLLRLRDTITSDAKIDKLTALYSERERTLRNFKIDFVRLERSNSDDNRNRTQLRLLGNQIDLLGQELVHLQTQISTTEILVNDVWKTVVATSPTKKDKPTRAVTVAGEFARGAKELASVLARFAAHIARLQRRHDIEVQAAAKLAKPWKTQMEELQLRMVIKLQRAYRARRRAQEIKLKAREELHDKIRTREIQKQNAAMDRKRQDALHEKDAQRHQNRMLARRHQEEAMRDAMQKKQQQLLARVREEQIAQRNQERDSKLQRRMLTLWCHFRVARQKKRNASRLFLRFQFLKWRHHYADYRRQMRAASRIQYAFRKQRERRRLRKVVQRNKKRQAVAKRYLQKIQSRQLQRVFNKWNEYVLNQIRLRGTFQAILQRRVHDWFQRWTLFVDGWKRKRLHAVVLVQRMYRERLARHVVKTQRLRSCSATLVQRVYRGHRGRRAAKRRRQINDKQAAGSRVLLQRLRQRVLLRCVDVWRSQTARERSIRQMAQRRRRQLLCCGFVEGFAANRHWKHAKRAALRLRQHAGASIIQRNFRRHRCQVVFRVAVRQHRSAIHIQRVCRGFCGRQRIRRYRWEIQAARTLQTIWRQRHARRLAEKTRAEGILLAAYKGDFTATQRAITMGYGHVVDDAEGNGILHMAAAAGHRRLVKLCLRHQLEINAANRHGQTPLHLLVTNLPPSGLHIHDDDDDDETRAVIDERVALAAYMVDHGAWHEAADEHGLTPLLLSAALGQAAATEMLLERCATTDARSSAGMNAAQLAVEGNHAATLQVLLASRGFDVAWHARETLLLLHTCAGRGLIDCLRVLLDHFASHTALSGNQLNVRDDDGYTPLIYAISNVHVDAVQCLLEHGASPDDKDFFGRSPLHFAVCVGDRGCAKIVELLTTYDVDVDVKDTDGDAALHTSCESDLRVECTSLLLRCGAQIGANALGNHPTHLAARRGAVETLKLLVEYGADMNIKNYAGKTPLGMARMVDQKRVVQFILEYFAAEPVVHDETDTATEAQVEDESDDHEPQEDATPHPARTASEWDAALASAFCMGTLAEWTHYIDAETEFSFFACASPDDPNYNHNINSTTSFSTTTATTTTTGVFCTWESPIEFDAALGETWEVMRGGGHGVASRSRAPPTSDAEADATDSVSTTLTGSGLLRAGSGVQYFYHNKKTGDVCTTVPAIDYSLLQDVVQNSKRHQRLRQKIHKVSADTSASGMEYMRFFHDFEAESAQSRAELLAAVCIQRRFRARRTRRMVGVLLFQNKSAIHLQRAFRGRRARQFATLRRHEHASATTIQAQWRGFWCRHQEQTTHRRIRVAHLHRRCAARQIQRLFRGYCARKRAYRERVVHKLGPSGYFAWEQARRRAVVRQSYKVWDEMELPREFPGVFFYCHQVTRSCAWQKPREWAAYDVDQFLERCQLFRWGYTQPMKRAAIRLQTLWRARQARIAFRLILKAVRLMKTAEREYLEDPTHLAKMGNYVLYLHAILHDYERARPLYGRLMRTMAQRGPDVPFILFSYALYLYVTQEDDVAVVEEMVLRAKLVDRQVAKYKMAFLGFFRQSLLQNPHDSDSNLNYAACLQWLYDQYDESIPYYLRAIAANPHKNATMELFQDMLTRKRQRDKAMHPSRFAHPTRSARPNETRSPQNQDTPDQDRHAAYDAFELFRRWQVQQAEQDDLVRRRQLEHDQETANRLQAARKIQARYRRRRAMRTVNRLTLERQMAFSVAELADTKAVYERVRLAFDRVNPLAAKKVETETETEAKTTSGGVKPRKNAVTPSNAPAKPMSLPMARLEDLFQAMDLSLSREELLEATAAFHLQFGKTLNVNVMDVTSFAQRNAVIATRIKTKPKAK